ncbi:MAG: ATP-grasp domain-containing protein [Candidatus Nomurabacteria bacterium]|jgi:D-alanine-D-alanine ligase|nr:ATP-grasp domain-containing protein [Candidatus Nomurabacteria bacterium]
MKKIAILYNLNRGNYEYEAEFDSELTIDSIHNALTNNYDVKKIEAVKDFSWIKELNRYKPDLVFNVSEGFNGPARESVYAAILEQFNYNYSGPDSTNLLMCHNKFLVKSLVKDIVLTPFGYSVQKTQDVEKLRNIKYPVIVKLNSEGSSMGLNGKSIVKNPKGLKKQINWLLNEYKRNIMVEEYVDGEDVSMIYVEGIGAMGPCLVDCDSEFYDYEMKTVKDSDVNISVVKGDHAKLKETTMKIAKRLDIKGYAKMDFRLRNDKYYLIEVNAQVSFHPTGEFITCAKTDDYDFSTVINHIVSNALKSDIKKNSVGISNNDVDR